MHICTRFVWFHSSLIRRYVLSISLLSMIYNDPQAQNRFIHIYHIMVELIIGTNRPPFYAYLRVADIPVYFTMDCQILLKIPRRSTGTHYESCPVRVCLIKLNVCFQRGRVIIYFMTTTIFRDNLRLRSILPYNGSCRYLYVCMTFFIAFSIF